LLEVHEQKREEDASAFGIKGGEYLKLCKILTEFPDKFRQYYRMNVTFDYILDSVKNDLQVILISDSALKQKRNLLLLFGTYWLLW